jgi:hypothetical protein
MRFLGFIILAVGLVAAFGPDYLDIGLPAGEYQPIGFVMIAVGGVLFLLGGRRKGKARREEAGKAVSKTSSIGYRQPEPEPEPEKRKSDIVWGRDGDDD